MDSTERSEWITSVAKYVRICAESVETITVKTKNGDVVTFTKGSENDD